MPVHPRSRTPRQRWRADMSKRIWLGLVACVVAQPVMADEGSVVGAWRLTTYEVEVQATGQKLPVMGQHPTGYTTFMPDGRVFFVLTAEGRKPAKTDQE